MNAGGVHSQRVKINHQDVPFVVEHVKGKFNPSDYISCHAMSISKLPFEQRKECDELNNFLYMLHATPIVDHISLGEISRNTGNNAVLSKLKTVIKEGRTFIRKHESKELRKFEPILSELSLTGNGIIL